MSKDKERRAPDEDSAKAASAALHSVYRPEYQALAAFDNLIDKLRGERGSDKGAGQ